VKTLLIFEEVADKNKLASFYGPRCIYWDRSSHNCNIFNVVWKFMSWFCWYEIWV